MTVKRFRSYEVADEPEGYQPTICEAAMATSAATSFFDPVAIGPAGQQYADGALVANNPVREVWTEAQNIWDLRDGKIEERVKCIVSIGTGDPGMKPLPDSMTGLVSAMVSLVTTTKAEASDFADNHRNLLRDGRYFRFNVQQGLQDVGLAEYKQKAKMTTATEDYLREQEMKQKLEICTAGLSEKDCTYAVEDFS